MSKEHSFLSLVHLNLLECGYNFIRARKAAWRSSFRKFRGLIVKQIFHSHYDTIQCVGCDRFSYRSISPKCPCLIAARTLDHFDLVATVNYLIYVRQKHSPLAA